jgi:hypothetical protein
VRQCLKKETDYEQWPRSAIEQALKMFSEAALHSVLRKPALVPEADLRDADPCALLHSLHRPENTAQC